MEQIAGCHHECELYTGRIPEAEESEHNWKTCQKNPGHLKFLPAPDFINNHLSRIQDETQREALKSLLDLTVRLRIRYTSQARPNDGAFSEYRGSNKLRVGTGFIRRVSNPVYNEPCPCYKCHGEEARKQWEFYIHTAHHVVYDTREALKTAVDLFYDDKKSQVDGRMMSGKGVEVLRPSPDRDVCEMKCVTCDEDLGERIESARKCFTSKDEKPLRKVLDDLGLLPSGRKDCKPVLIVSHPHAQPKQITVGELGCKEGENDLRQYTTPTCPGSSGAPVFLFDNEKYSLHWFTSVHNGSYDDKSPERYDRPARSIRLFNKLRRHKPSAQQLNYGHWGLWL